MKVGAFDIQFLPDGDDPGVGMMRVTVDGQQAEVGCDLDQWVGFVAAVKSNDRRADPSSRPGVAAAARAAP